MANVHLSLLSGILGWTYFIAWSISFYPQLLTNYRHRHSRLPGLSIHFLAYNFTGFAFYLIFTWTTYLYVRPRSVDINDIAFSAHAFLITSITIIQCFCYGRFQIRSISSNIDRLHAFAIVLLWTTPVLLAVAATFGRLQWMSESGAESEFSLIAYFGAAKVFITTVKYLPQAMLNWRLKSTVHWSLGNVLLDLTGGVLSLLQQCIDAYDQGTSAIFETNAPKLLLACLSMFFDFLFILQHVVYKKQQTDRFDPPLLASGDEESIAVGS